MYQHVLKLCIKRRKLWHHKCIFQYLSNSLHIATLTRPMAFEKALDEFLMQRARKRHWQRFFYDQLLSKKIILVFFSFHFSFHFKHTLLNTIQLYVLHHLCNFYLLKFVCKFTYLTICLQRVELWKAQSHLCVLLFQWKSLGFLSQPLCEIMIQDYKYLKADDDNTLLIIFAVVTKSNQTLASLTWSFGL